MKTLTVYHNSACSKCRKTSEILQSSGLPFQTVEYLDQPPTIEELDSVLRQLGMEPEALARQGEDEYQDLKAQGKLPTDRGGWLRLLTQQPILIERPIVTDGESAVIGRPPEKVSEWLKARGLT